MGQHTSTTGRPEPWPLTPEPQYGLAAIVGLMTGAFICGLFLGAIGILGIYGWITYRS